MSLPQSWMCFKNHFLQVNSGGSDGQMLVEIPTLGYSE